MLAGQDAKLRTVVGQLAALALHGTIPKPIAAFRQVTGATAARELAILSKRTAALANLIEGDNLHEPTILALADQGLLRSELRCLLPSLRRIAKVAEAACVKDTPETGSGGRPTDEHARLVTRILFDSYRELTGKAPTRLVDRIELGHPVYGPFHDLVSGVFAALGMRASPRAWVKDVTEKARRQATPVKQKTPEN